VQNDVHIRSRTTGRYLNPTGSWSALRSNSLKFLTVTEARNWCGQEQLVNVEIVVVRDALICMRISIGEDVRAPG
jgi:hypothetical protein